MDTARLEKKIAALFDELYDLEQEKKQSLSELNSQIRSRKRQMEAINASIKNNDTSYIIDKGKFHKDELVEMLGPDYATKGTLFEGASHG